MSSKAFALVPATNFLKSNRYKLHSFKGALAGLRYFLATESLVKMIKMIFN